MALQSKMQDGDWISNVLKFSGFLQKRLYFKIFLKILSYSVSLPGNGLYTAAFAVYTVIGCRRPFVFTSSKCCRRQPYSNKIIKSYVKWKPLLHESSWTDVIAYRRWYFLWLSTTNRLPEGLQSLMLSYSTYYLAKIPKSFFNVCGFIPSTTRRVKDNF